MMLMRRELLGGGDTYDAQVEYLGVAKTSSDYCYIDTGIRCKATVGFDFTCYAPTKGDTDNVSMIGGGPNQSGSIVTYNDWCGMSDYSWGGGGYSAGMKTGTLRYVDNKHIDTSTTDWAIYNNGSLIFSGNGVASDFTKAAAGYNLFLFCTKNNKWPIQAASRLYYCKLYDSEVLVRDFIPVKKDGVGYLYDRVTRKLFGNDGPGTFIVGPEVTT